jgi:anti-anti-sigma factor
MQVIAMGAVLRVAGDIDHASRDAFTELVDAHATPGTVICFDLRTVDFVDSSGVNVVLRALDAVGDDGCVVLHGPPRSAVRILGVLGLDDHPRIHVIEDRPAGGSGPGSTAFHRDAPARYPGAP